MSQNNVDWTNIESPIKSALLRGTANTSLEIPAQTYFRLTLSTIGHHSLDCLILNLANSNSNIVLTIEGFRSNANMWEIISKGTINAGQPTYVTNRHTNLMLHPTVSTLYSKVRFHIRTYEGTTTLFKVKWLGSYPNQSSPEGYTIDTDSNVTFPKNVTAKAFLGKSTSTNVVDSGLVSNTDVHAVYNGCPVGLSSVRLTSTTVTNLPPPGIATGNGATLLCAKYEGSPGNMIYMGLDAQGMWKKLKNRNGTFGPWVKILEDTAPELCAGTIAAMNIDNIRSGDQNGALVVYKLTTGTYTGTFPSGVDPTQMNCSTLRQEMHSGTNMVQTLNYHVKCATYRRYKFNGVWREWTEIGGTVSDYLTNQKGCLGIAAVVMDCGHALSESTLNSVLDPDSPQLENTREGALVLSRLNDGRAEPVLLRCDSDYFFQYQSTGEQLYDRLFIDSSAGLWYVDYFGVVQYRGNIVSNGGSQANDSEYIYYYILNTGSFSSDGKYKTEFELYTSLKCIAKDGVNGIITAAANPDDSNTACTKILMATNEERNGVATTVINYLNFEGVMKKCIFVYSLPDQRFTSIRESNV